MCVCGTTLDGGFYGPNPQNGIPAAWGCYDRYSSNCIMNINAIQSPQKAFLALQVGTGMFVEMWKGLESYGEV